MIVMKFGGTSVASPETILRVIEIVKAKNKACAVVVSAFGGVTNELESLAEACLDDNHHIILNNVITRHIEALKTLVSDNSISDVMPKLQNLLTELTNFCAGVALIRELSDRSRARVLSYGERLSSLIISEAFKQSSALPIKLIEGKKLIITDDNYLYAEVEFNTTNSNIKAAIDKESISIVPGFIASSKEGDITTLGRGGSDYTAAILASALDVEILEIWSDVSGMMSSNPRTVKQAESISELSYNEAFELSFFGAKVLYPPAIQPVLGKNIPILLKNTFDPDATGSLIFNKSGTEATADKVIGISSLSGLALLTVSGIGMIGIPGYSKRVFSALEKADINVILITQSCSEHSICIGIDKKDISRAKESLDQAFENELRHQTINEVEIESDLSIVALVGDKMKYQPGLSGKAFSVLGENGINIKAIAQGSSERNISIVIDGSNEKKALNVLHERFFGKAAKTVHLFVVGVGNVGSQFIKIIKQQQSIVKEQFNIDLKVAGLSNSRKMLFDTDGILLDEYEELLDNNGEKTDLADYVERIKAYNLRNSVFVDNTASREVSLFYEDLLSSSVSIAASNKIAPSDKDHRYLNLKSIAKERNVQFRYETCVGAALPVINTIQDLVLSGDKILKIDAVLSGSLNFIYNNYDSTKNYAEIVKLAGEEGYTEPDPLIDLGGTDVMRKILILAREAGDKLEMDDISSTCILPEKCMNSKNTEELFKELELNEKFFKAAYKNANEKGCKLKFVASYSAGKASVGLQEIPDDHPFYHLEGKDNIVALKTERYFDQPLVIKGAGAGADVTASGVFHDIMRIVNT